MGRGWGTAVPGRERWTGGLSHDHHRATSRRFSRSCGGCGRSASMHRSPLALTASSPSCSVTPAQTDDAARKTTGVRRLKRELRGIDSATACSRRRFVGQGTHGHPPRDVDPIMRIRGDGQVVVVDLLDQGGVLRPSGHGCKPLDGECRSALRAGRRRRMSAGNRCQGGQPCFEGQPVVCPCNPSNRFLMRLGAR